MAENADIAEEYVLGIDVGSTSIKATLVRKSDSQSVAQQRLECVETYSINDGFRSEQNISLIVDYVDRCIQALPAALLKRVVGIGICGQVHGVVCWSSKELPWSEVADGDGVFVNESKVSHLYTWQDNRCTPNFLASLPASRSHLSIHTGYGCATLFWLKANDPEILRKFDRAATIADFFVAMLCNLDPPHTSPQSAASWGYFDAEKDRFEESLLREANFPIHMLPQVRPDNGVAGTLQRQWHGIPAGVTIGVALGDLHAYVLAILQDESEAVVNISTSAQIVFVDRNFVPSKAEKTAAKVVPYFDGKYLHEGAALNGGNAISLFVDFVADSVRSLGCNVPKDQIWRHLIEESCSNQMENDSTHLPPTFVPTFLGERRCPQQRASICNLTPENFNLAALFRALCVGIVDNIHELVPLTVLRHRGIKKIVVTGTALLRNETLLQELRNRYAPLPVHSEQSASADSAVGSALSVIRLLDRQ